VPGLILPHKVDTSIRPRSWFAPAPPAAPSSYFFPSFSPAVVIPARSISTGIPDTASAEPGEVIGRLAWRTADREVATAVGGYAGVLVLSGPPAMSNPGRARDTKATQLLAIDAFAVDRELVDAQVRVDVDAV
jgi:hypothetical protein